MPSGSFFTGSNKAKTTVGITVGLSRNGTQGSNVVFETTDFAADAHSAGLGRKDIQSCRKTRSSVNFKPKIWT